MINLEKNIYNWEGQAPYARANVPVIQPIVTTAPYLLFVDPALFNNR